MTLKSQLKQTFLFVQGKKFNTQLLAPSYDKISSNFTLNFNYTLEECYYQLFEMLGAANNNKVLDLGCGTGWLGDKLFANKNINFYHGIDISTGMIYQAKKTLNNQSNIKLDHGNFLELLDQVEDSSFDLVFLTWSLKFNNRKKLLEKIKRVLKPGGKLALLTDTANSQQEISNAVETLIRSNMHQVDLALPKTYLPQDAYTITKDFNEAGFKQTIVWNKTLNFDFNSPTDVTNWAQAMGFFAGWDQILDLYQPQLTQELQHNIEPVIPGKWLITKRILGAIAIK